jgi:hypothetical protein
MSIYEFILMSALIQPSANSKENIEGKDGLVSLNGENTKHRYGKKKED